MTHFSMIRCFFAVALVLSLGLVESVAGTLATTNRALNDGFGPDAGRWHGSVLVSGAAFGDTVTAEVDWAAFGPGKFQQFLNDNGYAGSDPSGPNEVLYVYEIVSVTAASPGIDTLTVGLDAADGRGASSAPDDVVHTGGVNSPTSGGDNSTSMAWFFDGTELQVGDTSSLLVFSSPFAPEFDFLQVNSGLGGPAVSPLVASPSDRIFRFDIPEPTTLVLALACAFPLLGRRQSR